MLFLRKRCIVEPFKATPKVIIELFQTEILVLLHIMENALFQNANSIFHGTLVLRLLYLDRENERVVVFRPLGVISVQFRGDPVTVCNHGLLAVVADNKCRNATKVLQSMVIHRNPLRLPRRGYSLRINVLGVW